MKKMMCIKSGWRWLYGGQAEPSKDPVYGEIVTVLKEYTHHGVLCYFLESYDNWYDSKHFIPISSIDETKFERNYKKEPAWIEAFNKL